MVINMRFFLHRYLTEKNNVMQTGNTSSQALADIRLDEEYEQFYQAQIATGKKLPPPLEGRTLYNDLAAFSSSESMAAMNDIQQILQQRHGPNSMDVASQVSAGNAIERPASVGGGTNGGVAASVLHALSQMNVAGNEISRGSSPLPQMPSANSYPNLTSLSHQANQMQDVSRLGASTPPPMPVSSGMMGGSNSHRGSGFPAQGNPQMDYHLAYQAAYHAALQQQAAQLYVGQAMPGAGFPVPQNHQMMHNMQMQQPMNGMLAAATAAQMALNPGMMHNNPTAAAAAAAAAAMAMANQNGSRGGPRNTYSEGERRSGGSYEKRNKGKGQEERNLTRGPSSSRQPPGSGLLGPGGPDDDVAYQYETLEQIMGKVAEVARDQVGCRFLQKKFDDGGAAAIDVVFQEILDNILDLMTDPFGNYLIQKMLDRCSEEQRLQVLKATSSDGDLIKAALNTHGTRAVQKLIETLTSREQTELVVSTLSPGVVNLIRDLNGNHVIQRCLQRMSPIEAQFIYDAACEHCHDIATHRHGCCVLQRCIDFSTNQQRRILVENIAAHSLPLSQDPFGNYVVQYVLELGHTESSSLVMENLRGHYSDLAVQKFSSNVVEKCLKLGGAGLTKSREAVVIELMESPSLGRLLQDPYANYVMQSALAVTSGELHSQLVDAIRPHLTSLRGTPHGKRILAKISVKI